MLLLPIAVLLFWALWAVFRMVSSTQKVQNWQYDETQTKTYKSIKSKWENIK